MSSTNFYRAFEERFYAPRSVIKHLRQQYLPFVQPLAMLYPGGATFDIGCGRGEWLELMQELGMSPFGVDLDAGMLQGCHELDLPAQQGDAVAYLQTLANNSQAVVTAFHVVEHISFEQLKTVVIESLRVLKPGGLLIMETPNPENIVVATRNFYLDPTHLQPIPPLLLSFLPEHHGFARVHTVRLQEPQELHQRSDITLMDVLGGVSPDYAVVAQKAAAPEQMQPLDEAFSTARGIDLNTLVQRFDERLAPIFMQDEFIARIETHIDAKLTPLLDQITYAQESCAQAAEARAQAAEARAQAAEARVQAAETERNALRQSISWRITAPLRGAAQWILHPSPLTHAAANASQGLLAPLMRTVLKNPRLSYRINQVLMRYPFVYQHLLAIARRSGIVTDLSVQALYGTTADQQGTESLSTLTPEAHAIYAQLKAEAGSHKEPH